MILRRTVLALAAAVAIAAPAAAQEAETIETVAQEFLGIMKGRGFADARYQSISGTAENFAIRGFKGSRKDSSGTATSFSIDVLTVEGLQPDDRWTRAEAVRADGVRFAAGATKYEFGTIYANKAGILDIDGSRPSATFGTMILKAVAASTDGAPTLRIDEAYAAADRWVGEFGVPGRLDLTIKGAASAGALPFLPSGVAVAFGNQLVPSEVRLKTSLADVRDELSVAALVKTEGRGSWQVEGTVVNFDKGLFQSWLDLENPDDERTAERQRRYEEDFAKERADIGLKALNVTFSGLDWIPADVRARIASSPYIGAVSALVGASSASGLQAALETFAKGASSFTADGYARAPVRIGDAASGKPEVFAPLLFRFSAK